MPTLRVNDLSVQVHLGCTEGERASSQEVRFSLEFRFPKRPLACITDQLKDTFCYAETCGFIKRVAMSRHFETIEALTHHTREAVRSLIPRGMTGTISIHKVNPPVADLKGGVFYEEAIDHDE